MIAECGRCALTADVPTMKGVLRWHRQHSCCADAAPDPKRVCGACLVTASCLQHAIDNDIRHGVWGGLSPQQRRRITPTKESAA